MTITIVGTSVSSTFKNIQAEFILDTCRQEARTWPNIQMFNKALREMVYFGYKSK